MKLLVALIVALSPAIAFSQEQSIETLKARIVKLEKRVQELEKLESRIALLEKSLSIIRSRQRKEMRGKPTVGRISSGRSPLVLTSWSHFHSVGDFNQQYYTITLNLKNNSKKDIKLIDGTVQFYDLLDNQIYGIVITPDLRISSGSTLQNSGKYPINQFIAKQARMKGLNRDDIKVKMVIKRIVFTDNTVLKVRN